MGQSVSTTQWFLYGKRNFTQTGYLKHIKSYSSPVQDSAAICRGAEGADGVDLGGKCIVVTGANSGLGKEIATYAAAKGANLYMLCRSKERAEKARDEISEKTSNENIKILLADVGELAQVRKVAEELQSQEEKVDCLVCNAGVLLNDRSETSEGNEATFASHFLGGSYLLSQLLLPQLKSAGTESRVVFVTSGGMLLSKFPSWEIATNDKTKGGKYDGTKQYTYAKRGQVLLAERMAKLYPELKWVTGHPGWAATAAVDDAFGEDKKYLEPMRSEWQGAEGLTWLMSTESKNLVNGAFYLDRSVQKKHIAGAFMTEGSYTRNKDSEVDEMMENLKKASGL
uniref:Dehydrogenase/reductase SDR family member 12 n=1 Tax=Pseudictyota dubia TaxID=2749911 RepID=A0A7R9Z4V4_9STRA|mmetsp:Transcript_23464/g.43406  ORF Transcript_23464/g.43406 Transcript_23464/m.43406 type:complete len:341 (+) Transcript_23464:130-1152(+)|eukprot:CAMPEP_0197453152 /NCGR_PEP_ID=MMETSP1175-20131217/34134_1 /TAXON_ID=1003142 /ORGANISM="Triceratium dubium, Strain CCMP147" /LENGTH=340 /DNA_ID=CAMNT_0042986351 /DNA_START=130 /DNA_END=1152 /DNA_ORIENTATION=-